VRDYDRGVRRLITRLLLLVSVLLMPFGMAAAPAAASQHQHMGAMAMQHCPDRDSKSASKGALADCAMACSAALPAADPAPIEARPFSRAPLDSEVTAALSDIDLDIATPPPRFA